MTDVSNITEASAAQQDRFEHYCALAPTAVQFELTDRCNIGCRFCYQSPSARHSGRAREIISRLAEAAVLELTLTGGEPTLHPDFRALAAHAIESTGLVGLQTNATLLDEDLISYLEDCGLAKMNISLHGGEALHDRLTRTPGGFRRASAAAARVAASGKIKLWVNAVLTSDNWSALPEHFNILYERGIRAYTLTRFVPTGIGRAEAALAPSREQIVGALELIRGFLDSHPGSSCELVMAFPACGLPEHVRNFAGNCTYGLARFYVDIEGNLLHCGMLRRPYGNVLETPLAEIKRGSSMFRQECCNQLLPQECASCERLYSCHGGCRAAAYAAGGVLAAADPLWEGEAYVSRC